MKQTVELEEKLVVLERAPDQLYTEHQELRILRWETQCLVQMEQHIKELAARYLVLTEQHISK